MVREWEEEVELRIVERLEQAAREGNYMETAATAKRLGRSCRSCHREFRALASTCFRGPRFEEIKIQDGSAAEQEYGEHMKELFRTLNRVKIANEDERSQAAGEALRALRQDLDRLGETCAACHDDEPPRQRIPGGET